MAPYDVAEPLFSLKHVWGTPTFDTKHLVSVLYQVHVPLRLEMDLTSGVPQAFKRAKLFIHLTSVATIIAITTPATPLLL